MKLTRTKLTREEQLNKLFQTVAELLVKNAKEGVPETGSFQKLTVGGKIKGADYESILGIEQSYQAENERRVTLGMHRTGDDRLVSNDLFKGTKEEVLAWLESPEGLEQIIEAYKHLEARVKDF